MAEIIDQDINAIDRDLKPVLNLVDLYESKQIDMNKDGFISRREISRAISSTDRSTDDSVSLAVLNIHQRQLKHLHDDGKDEKKGLSKNDVIALSQLGLLEGMKRIANGATIFRFLDQDGNGRLSKDELKIASQNLKQGVANESVKYMLANFEIISQGGNEISAKQVTDYVAKQMSLQQQELLYSFVKNAREAREKLASTDPRIYADDRANWKAVDGKFVTQGQIGDCWLQAALSSLAEKNPQALAQMVVKNNDGTYRVTFPLKVKGKSIDLNVGEPTRAELATYGGTGVKGKWGAIIEKAVAELFKQHPELREPLTGMKPVKHPANAYANLHGARRPAGIEILTGLPAERVPLKNLSSKELDKLLQAAGPITASTDAAWPKRLNQPVKDALSDGGLTAGINPSDERADHDRPPPTPKDEWFLPNDGDSEDDDNDDDDGEKIGGHEFAVLGYDAEKKIVTVRNPWGQGELVDKRGQPLDGKDDGIMQLSLLEFSKYFNAISLAKK